MLYAYALKKKKNRKTLRNQSADVLECTLYDCTYRTECVSYTYSEEQNETHKKIDRNFNMLAFYALHVGNVQVYVFKKHAVAASLRFDLYVLGLLALAWLGFTFYVHVYGRRRFYIKRHVNLKIEFNFFVLFHHYIILIHGRC